MSLRDEELQMKTEDFNDEYIIHYKKVALPVASGRDEEAAVTVFEKKKDFDSNVAAVFNHGATSIADKKIYKDEAKEIAKDEELSDAEQKELSDKLEDRGERYDEMPLSYIESRKYESAADSWHRMRYHLGNNHPQFTVSVSFGTKGLYILAPDKKGKKIENATVSMHNKIADEALVEVGSSHNELWSLSHSMGGLNSLACLMDQAKNKKPNEHGRISKAVLVDMLLFPGDMNASALLEFFLKGNVSSVLARYIVQTMLYETEWRETNPLGKNFLKLLDFPPTFLHSNTESMWKFDVKHNEIIEVVNEIGATQFVHSSTPTSHSYMPGKRIAEFLTGTIIAGTVVIPGGLDISKPIPPGDVQRLPLEPTRTEPAQDETTPSTDPEPAVNESKSSTEPEPVEDSPTKEPNSTEKEVNPQHDPDPGPVKDESKE